MNAPLAPLHSPFGGSVAARVLRCKGSVRLVEQVPDYLRKSSIYANRGTALHAAMALLIDEKSRLDDLIGETLNDYTVTIDDVETALRPAYAHVSPLLDAPDAEFYLEQRVVFPTIPEAFGTLDLCIRNRSTIRITDFKFGNLPVRVLYPRGDEDVLNPQLMYYGAAARHSLPEFFVGVDKIILSIVQPQSLELDAKLASAVEVTHAELDEFIAVFRAAYEEALSESPRLERGDHCRFCPAKPICPEHTKPLLDLAQFVVPTPPATPADRTAYLQALAAGLDLVDATKDLRTALHDQAKAALEQGDCVPGYALSAGRAERRWRDESAAVAALERLGLSRDDIIASALRSPKQVELRARARGLKVPPEFIVSARSGTSLVRAENAHAPTPHRDELVRSFTEALKAQGGHT